MSKEFNFEVSEGTASWTGALHLHNFSNFDNISGLPGREVISSSSVYKIILFSMCQLGIEKIITVHYQVIPNYVHYIRLQQPELRLFFLYYACRNSFYSHTKHNFSWMRIWNRYITQTEGHSFSAMMVLIPFTTVLFISNIITEVFWSCLHEVRLHGAETWEAFYPLGHWTSNWKV